MNQPSIVVDPATFDVHRTGEVKHFLTDHPLMALERLCALASRLPSEQVRWHRGDIPIGTHFGRAAEEHPNGRSIDDTLANIEQAGSWVYLQHIERDVEYAGLVRDALSSVAPFVSPDLDLREMAGWVFIASPGAVTPYHMDHETNLLLQIRGTKSVDVWDPSDRSIVGEDELECLHGRYSLDETHWRDELSTRATTFAVRPGVGVFMPFTAPHAVRNDDNVSVSLSLTFVTRENIREQRAFAANHALRRVGLRPRAVGVSPRLDALKGAGLSVARRCRQVWRNGRSRQALWSLTTRDATRGRRTDRSRPARSATEP